MPTASKTVGMICFVLSLYAFSRRGIPSRKLHVHVVGLIFAVILLVGMATAAPASGVRTHERSPATAE